MNFWKQFPKKQAIRQFVFTLFLFALLIPAALLDSATQVKVKFYDIDVLIKSDKYTMTVPYDIIEEAELAALPEPGEKVEHGFDDDILRSGVWQNDTWGEYHIAADLDAGNCIVLHLDDGRIFVFSSKNDTKTEKIYRELLTHLS